MEQQYTHTISHKQVTGAHIFVEYIQCHVLYRSRTGTTMYMYVNAQIHELMCIAHVHIQQVYNPFAALQLLKDIT